MQRKCRRGKKKSKTDSEDNKWKTLDQEKYRSFIGIPLDTGLYYCVPFFVAVLLRILRLLFIHSSHIFHFSQSLVSTSLPHTASFLSYFFRIHLPIFPDFPSLDSSSTPRGQYKMKTRLNAHHNVIFIRIVHITCMHWPFYWMQLQSQRIFNFKRIYSGWHSLEMVTNQLKWWRICIGIAAAITRFKCFGCSFNGLFLSSYTVSSMRHCEFPFILLTFLHCLPRIPPFALCAYISRIY